ncbi:MAG: SDR family NAD(P)-dependent oxidoreductase, partial [Actinomycetota bacterium]
MALARAGHTVYATMRKPSPVHELASTAAAEGLDIRLVAMDVNNDASVELAMNKILSECPTVDILINNAGVGSVGSVEELPMEEFRNVMETNYFGVLRCTKAILPGMRERRSGCIVNVSSIAGRVASAPQAAYAASKFALEAISEVLAEELKAFNIRVAIVEPGVIKTPIYDKAREIPTNTLYPHERRLHAMNAASMANPVLPEVVAKKIMGIVDGDTWQLRHPVGPDAKPMIAWRKMLSDEEWIDRFADPDDNAWLAMVKRDFGVDLSPFLPPASRS